MSMLGHLRTLDDCEQQQAAESADNLAQGIQAWFLSQVPRAMPCGRVKFLIEVPDRFLTARTEPESLMYRPLFTSSLLALFLGITTANPLAAQTTGVPKTSEATPVEAKAEATTVSHVVLVVDSTASMAWANRESQPARMTLARKAASLMVDLVPAGTPLSVLALQDGVSAVRPMSPLRASDRQGIRASLTDLKPKGHGKLSSCFSQVERVLKQTPQGEQRLSLKDVRPLVVIITDGDDCQVSEATGYASVLSSQVNDELRLAIVGLCTREAVAAPLRNLATTTHGWFTQLETENGLEAAFARTRDECNAIRGKRPAVAPQLAEQLLTLTKDNTRLKNELKKSEDEAEACKTAGIKKDTKIGELTTDRDNARDERDGFKKNLHEANGMLVANKKQIDELTKEIAELSAARKTAENQVTTLTEKVVAKTEKLNADIIKLTSEEEKLATEVKSVAGLKKSVEENLNTLEGRVNNWWKQLLNSSLGIGLLSILVFVFKTPALRGLVKSLVNNEAFSTQFDSVKSEVDSVKSEVDQKVTAEVGGVKSDVGVVAAEVGNVKNDVGKVTAEVGTVKTEVSSVKSEVTAVKTGIDQVKSSVDGVKAGVEEKVQQLSSQLAEQLSSFDRQLAERMQKFEAQLRETSLTLTSDIDTASTSVKTVESKVDSTKEKADEIEKAISAVKSQLSQTDQAVAAKVASLETAVAETRSDVKESIKECVAAKLDSVEKTVSESKSEVRQLVGENQRTLASQMSGVETAVSGCRDEIVSSVQAAISASEKTIESTCRESASQVVQKVDGLGQNVSDLHAGQQQLGAEVRHVYQTVNPLAKAVADNQTSMQSQSAESRVELEKKLNKLSRDLTKAVEKVHGRIELRTKEIGDGVREAQQQMDQQVRKQVRRMGDSVAERVSESVSQSVHGHFAEQQEWQQGALNGVQNGQEQLLDRVGQVTGELENLRTAVADMPKSIGSGLSLKIDALGQKLGEIADAAESVPREAAQDVADSMTGVADSMSSVADSVQLLDARLSEVAEQVEQLREGLGSTEAAAPAPQPKPRESSSGQEDVPLVSPKQAETSKAKQAPKEEVSEEQLQAVRELRRVKGIGPAYAKALYQAGVPSVEALATLSDERIAEVDESVPNVEDLINAARMFLVRER